MLHIILARDREKESALFARHSRSSCFNSIDTCNHVNFRIVQTSTLTPTSTPTLTPRRFATLSGEIGIEFTVQFKSKQMHSKQHYYFEFIWWLHYVARLHVFLLFFPFSFHSRCVSRADCVAISWIEHTNVNNGDALHSCTIESRLEVNGSYIITAIII